MVSSILQVSQEEARDLLGLAALCRISNSHIAESLRRLQDDEVWVVERLVVGLNVVKRGEIGDVWRGVAPASRRFTTAASLRKLKPLPCFNNV